ncbi:hypothetical protein AB1Y20_010681 [Prymnesium parvum]|uniref:Uncharacterized protein n=1 Tax=Prymnesium parvum TaxID=97485 RepID=A0AB34IS39_PRYPA
MRSDKRRQKAAIEAAVVNEMLYDFEERIGLAHRSKKPQKSSTEIMDMLHDEQRRHQQRDTERLWAKRSGTMTIIEPVCIRPVPLRPDTAPARTARAQAALKRNESTYSMWYDKYREELEAGERILEQMRIDAAREHKERVQRRREGLLATFHEKQKRSKMGAVDRSEPFWKRKEQEQLQQSRAQQQRHRVLSQEIIFVPKSMSSHALTPDRFEPDFEQSVEQVRSL